MATLDDVVTTQKNGVIAINAISRLNAYLSGQITSSVITSQSLVIAGSGRLVSYSIVVKGTTAATMYNASSVSAIADSNVLLVTTDTQEVGVYQAGLNFSSGLVVEPGDGQSINVTYSVNV